MKNLRAFFVLHPIMEKKLSRFSKIHFRLLGILPGKQLVKMEKMTVLSFWKREDFGGKVVFRTPPKVVSGIGRGGGCEITWR
jgi:hypothetical protein